MPDLSYRFDDITEEFYDRQLAEIRAFAESFPITDQAILEIGSNKGLFTTQLAGLHPDRTMIGVEIRKKYAEEANAKLARDRRPNAHVVRAGAEIAVPVLFDDGQVQDVFVLYPDPWWKKRQRKRRVIRHDFLNTLLPKLAMGANLWVRTDVGPLANDMRAVLHEHPAFTPIPLAEHPTEAFPRSERDLRSVRLGLPVHRLYFRKTADTPFA